MKNGTFKKILSLTLVVLMVLTAVFATGCAKKDKDKDKDEITLEDIKEKAEDAGYEVNFTTNASISAMFIRDEDNGTSATVVEYEDADAAKEAYEEAKTELDELDELDETLGYEVKRSGKVVIVGDKEIVEAIW